MRRRTVYVRDGELTKEQRRNFKKENPGKRLAFPCRYPNFPIYLSTVCLIMSIVVLIVQLLKLSRLL